MSSSSGHRRLDWILSPDPARSASGPGAGLSVGVLALQGDFREHRVVLERLGARTFEVRAPRDLSGLDGLVIPGGESTTMNKLIVAQGLEAPLRAFHAAGGAVLGTCAGLILAAAGTVEGAPPTLGFIEITARRNAFGRQVHSFEAELPVAGVPGGPVRAAFIRAPWIEHASPAVEVLASWEGHGVVARQGRVLVCAFHPEITGEARLHELFLEMIRGDHRVLTTTGDAEASAGALRGAVAAACGNR